MTEPVKFSLPVTVSSIKMFGDRSVGVNVRSTQEINNAEFAEIHKAFQAIGWFVFSSNIIPTGELPKEDAPEGRKTRVERILGAIYVLHLKSGSPDDFDTFRARKLDGILQQLREEIAEFDE